MPFPVMVERETTGVGSGDPGAIKEFHGVYYNGRRYNFGEEIPGLTAARAGGFDSRAKVAVAEEAASRNQFMADDLSEIKASLGGLHTKFETLAGEVRTNLRVAKTTRRELKEFRGETTEFRAETKETLSNLAEVTAKILKIVEP